MAGGPTAWIPVLDRDDNFVTMTHWPVELCWLYSGFHLIRITGTISVGFIKHIQGHQTIWNLHYVVLVELSSNRMSEGVGTGNKNVRLCEIIRRKVNFLTAKGPFQSVDLSFFLLNIHQQFWKIEQAHLSSGRDALRFCKVCAYRQIYGTGRKGLARQAKFFFPSDLLERFRARL